MPRATLPPMRSLLIGFFSGLVLSALRAPAGVELLQLPATSAGAAMAFRAGAFLVIAVGLLLGTRRSGERFSPLWMLTGAAVGYPLHGLFGDSASPLFDQLATSLLFVVLLVAGHRGRGPEARPNKLRLLLLGLAGVCGWFLIEPDPALGHGKAVFTALVGAFAIAVVGRSTTTPADETQDAAERPANGTLFGIAIGGAGVAILVEGLARHLRLLGGGLSADDSVFGAVFLALALFGAVAFGRLVKETSRTLLTRGVLFGLAGLTAWGTFRVLGNFADPRGIDIFVRNAGLDSSFHGTLFYDALLAGPVLVLPAFLVGTLVALHRTPQELGALLVGAAGGLVVAPHLLVFEAVDGEVITQSHSAALALFGGTIAAGGAIVSFLGTAQLTTPQRLIGCVLAVVGIALCRFPEREAIPILSPWLLRTPIAELVADTPTGLVTIELDVEGVRVATLDRRDLTPRTKDVAADRRRFELAWQMLGELEEDTGPRVLLVGQLDPGRALHLLDLGASSVDRTSSWFASMDLLEHWLFEGNRGWVPGEVLAPGEARARLAKGRYDLVLVPPVLGDAPTTRNLASPAETTAVVWLDGGTGIETQHFGQIVLATAPVLRELQVAVVRGPEVEARRLEGGQGSPGFLLAGEPVGRLPVLELLQLREPQRPDRQRARLAERFAAAERTPGLAAGLAAHFGAQRQSSPFSDPVEAIEVSEEACERFAEAASAPEPDGLTIEVIEALAFVLGRQRKVEEIDRYLAGPAERHAPWPALDVALGLAALEFLDPELALEHLERAHSAFPGTPESLAMLAEAQSQTGDDAGAVVSLERAQAQMPGLHALERRLAIAWVRAGDPRGPDAVRAALAIHPGDQELLDHSGAGPYPPPPPGHHTLAGHLHTD